MNMTRAISNLFLSAVIGFAPSAAVFADSSSSSKTLILRYAKPPVFGSGTATDCSDVSNNIIKFLKSTSEESIMCTTSVQINVSPDPVNEVTNTVQGTWEVYNGPSNRIYNSSVDNLNTAVITPPYDSSSNVVTYTYELVGSGTDTFQYQLSNYKSLTASYDSKAYTLQGCQDDTTDSDGEHIVCIFEYNSSESE